MTIIEILPLEIQPHIGVIRYTRTTNVRHLPLGFWEKRYLYPILHGQHIDGPAEMIEPDQAAWVVRWKIDSNSNLWALYDEGGLVASIACWGGVARAEFYPNLDIFEYHRLADLGKLPKPVSVCKIRV